MALEAGESPHGQRARTLVIHLRAPRGTDPGDTIVVPPGDEPHRRTWVVWGAAVVAALLFVLFAGYIALLGVRAQVDARLRAAGAGANSALIVTEAEQLTLLRAITFTAGVGAALQAKNSVALDRLVTPLQSNSDVPMVDLVRPGGVVILAIRSRGAPRPVASRHGLPALAETLAQAHGKRGGRFSEVVTLQDAPILLTIGPLLVGSRPVGAVLTMTPLADVLARLSTQVGATLTAYNANGTPVATTSSSARPSPLPAARARTTFAGGPVWAFELGTSTREMIGRLIVEHHTMEVLGVAVHDDALKTEFLVDLAGVVGILIASALLVATRRRLRT